MSGFNYFNPDQRRTVFGEFYWVIRRHMWLLPVTTIILGKYSQVIPQKDIVNFLEKGCFPNIVILPFVVVLIFILSHICEDLGDRRIRRRPFLLFIAVAALYFLGIIFEIVADWINIGVFSIMLFPHSGLLPINVNAEQLQVFEEYWYGLFLVPVLDYFIFRVIISRSLVSREIREQKLCSTLSKLQRNFIWCSICFLMIVISLQVICV